MTGVGGLLGLALFRTRFLSASLGFQWFVFIVLYLAGRLEFNFPYYYLIHSALLMVFAVGLPVLIAQNIASATIRFPKFARRSFCGVALMLLVVCLRPDLGYQKVVDAFSYKIDERKRSPFRC